MPELRKDPVTGRWVIIATDRLKGPADYTSHPADAAAESASHPGFCPFCQGNEGSTPPETLAYRPHGGAPNGPGWTVRVVPNRAPALRIEGELERAGEGMYDKMNGVGAHEVIIDTPTHDARTGSMAVEQIERLLWAYRDRILDLEKDGRFRYVMIFKNHGAQAGATVMHPHSQLIALPVVPAALTEELAGAEAHFQQKERCIYCDIVRQELGDGRRLVYENEGFVALAPFAPKFPFETWILPRRHASAFEHGQQADHRLFAEALRTTLGKLDVALDRPAFSYTLHTSPLRRQESAYYHWHLEILPALGRVAGFEWGSGFYINPTPPEEAARFLREIEARG